MVESVNMGIHFKLSPFDVFVGSDGKTHLWSPVGLSRESILIRPVGGVTIRAAFQRLKVRLS